MRSPSGLSPRSVKPSWLRLPWNSTTRRFYSTTTKQSGSFRDSPLKKRLSKSIEGIQMTTRDAAFWVLVQAWRKTKPGKTRDKTFAEMHKTQEKHLKFYSYKFQSMTIPIEPDDLNQAAEMGFLRALEKWDPKRGSWITCLFMWVRREIQNYNGLEPIVYRPQGV